jgi:hypothetical protein
VGQSLDDRLCCELLLPLQLRDVLLGDDLIRLGVSIHVLCESRDPEQTLQRVKGPLNLDALVCALALKFYRCVLGGQYVLDGRCAQCARNVLFALTFQSLALVQLSVGNVMREALNARGYELPSSKLLLDQYLCSDVLALTLAL